MLAISAVEGLAVDTPWTDQQVQLLKAAAFWVRDTYGDNDGVSQVVETIESVWKGDSIRQRIRKLLETNGLSRDQWRAWDDLYAKRSKLAHGRSKVGDDEARGGYLEQTGLHKFGQVAATLCTKIVLSIAVRNGMPAPKHVKVDLGIQ